MARYYDIATIFYKRPVKEDGFVEYIPLKVVSGNYDYDNDCFIDDKGQVYYHLLENADYAFANRINKRSIRREHPLLPLSVIKKIIFNSFLKYNFHYYYLSEKMCGEKVPIVLMGEDSKKGQIYMDHDAYSFYEKNYPIFHDEICNGTFQKKLEEKQKEQIKDKRTKETEIDLSTLYELVTDSVIDQDEPIKKILTAIWKHYNNFSSTKSRNILINGSTGVGKTETFRILSQLIDVPFFITSATEYTAAGYVGKSVDDMLIGLLSKTGGDLEKAERGILVIDEIDKLSESSNNSSQVNQRDVQEALLKILEDGVFNVIYEKKNYSFDTSKLLVVGMGSWSRIDLTPDKVVGFENVAKKKTYKDITREEIVKNGIIPELIARFPILVQMNELTYDSFIRILKSKNNVVNLNKEFFSKKGVELIFDDSAINEVARIAQKDNYGARGLDEIIERSLAIASFEIGSHPDLYSKLLITDETINDNKKYTLVKKNES